MDWECQHCHQLFNFAKYQQKGAHITNCAQNPKRAENIKKAADGARQALCVFKIDLELTCPTCSNMFIQSISQNEMDNGWYKKYCSRECFNRRLGRPKKKKKYYSNKEYRQSFEDKRLQYQQIGQERIKLNAPLYIAGCMLYWGEGSKSINTVQLTNSDANLLLLFKKFLYTFWDVNDKNIVLSINCYTDLHSVEEIEEYWINKLSLSRSNLRKTMVNKLPISSKNKKKNKLEYGTARLTANKTEIVQEIYGAIQEFGGNFFYEHWVKHTA